ncbi:MAG: DUF2284 domain-containing protein [Defluviitaleaceae bacterium]|nr:DUF2284 domain-containing protein [Defluviitaleaceae bacterium]
MDIINLCIEAGATKAEQLPVGKLLLDPGLIEYCKQDACGRYNRSYTCPPLLGDINNLIEKIKNFTDVIIWQNIYTIEDSFDFEGMMAAQDEHKKMAHKIAKLTYARIGRKNALILSAGACQLCDACACITGEACRYPAEALSSLEAHGINVSQISEISGLKYINGVNTVTYFGGVFVKYES